MASQDSPFTKENLELLLNLGKKLILGQVDKIASEIKELLNPDIRFANMLKAKYDALVAAGFNEKQAFELALKAVEETLKQATEKKEETQ